MKPNRRDFIQTLGAGVAGFSVAPLSSGASNSRINTEAAPDDQQLFVGDDIAVANTEYGKVQGFILRDIFNFRGIPYGADTGGKNRFMPPQKPEPWNDIKPAVWWGNTAPQIMDNRYANAWSSFADHWNYDDVSEDCLKLNVWTPALADGKKRPVLVWLHGGGYTNGNGIEQDGYDGENFSRKGDVVFVSINHRLGPIGFSDLSGVGGSKYADSGNVGALDMVAALEWVKINIANFGGDPGNVTIMGQSGGGAKVCTVMAMPKAKGLFHKGVPLSGSSTSANDQEVSRKLGEYILKEAGLSAGEIDKLQEMPWKDYIFLATKAAGKMRQENPDLGFRGGFAPVQDGRNIPKGTYFSEPNGLSSDVPMLICSTFHEWGASRTNPQMEKMTKQEAINTLKQRAGFMAGLGDKAESVYNAYAEIFPDAKPIEVMTLISSNRMGVVSTANAKSVQKAPVYVAWFGWEPPMFNGRMRAFHCLDICFWFANTDLMLTHTGGGERPRKLGEKMSDSLLAFMKTGNPNAKGLPNWPAFTKAKGETMILNDDCVVKNDPDRKGREMLG
ncbi:MAG: carboxylesterase/lipase family protein [Cytophagia bacterium]|nr:carboxylesterase/lipase family protein [Cytophagia bacterium]